MAPGALFQTIHTSSGKVAIMSRMWTSSVATTAKMAHFIQCSVSMCFQCLLWYLGSVHTCSVSVHTWSPTVYAVFSQYVVLMRGCNVLSVLIQYSANILTLVLSGHWVFNCVYAVFRQCLYSDKWVFIRCSVSVSMMLSECIQFSATVLKCLYCYMVFRQC